MPAIYLIIAFVGLAIFFLMSHTWWAAIAMVVIAALCGVWAVSWFRREGVDT